MPCLCTGPLPAVRVKTGYVLAAVITTLLAGGCSSNPSKPSAWSMGGHLSGQQQVATESPRHHDLEEDGMEAQVAPPPSIRMAPDDPSEPFSPNYGGRPSSEPAAQPAPSPAQTRPAPPANSKPPRSKFAAAAE